MDKYRITRDLVVESVSLMIFKQYAGKLITSLRLICKKMCSVYVTSLGIIAFLHAVTIGNPEENKKIRRHNRILTNEELKSNEPHVDYFLHNGQRKG